MIFRFSIDSSFPSAAVVAVSMISATSANRADQMVTDYDPPMESKNAELLFSSSDKFVSKNIKTSYHPDIDIADIESLKRSLLVEDVSEKSLKNRHSLQQRSTMDESDRGNGKPLFEASRNLGILNDSTGGDPIPATRIHDNRHLQFDCDSCRNYGERPLLPADADMKFLTSMCYFNGVDSYGCPGDIKCWDTSQVTSLKEAFYKKSGFNEPLECWDVSSVTDMYAMFQGASSFNQSIADWDVSSVTSMRYMFRNALEFNQPIGDWNVSSVTDMTGTFWGTFDFDSPIDEWDTCNVKDMDNMFVNASSFNQGIGEWNISAVTSTRSMFKGATSFNQPIGKWDTSSVSDMSEMFKEASSFNQPVGVWVTTSVGDMSYMFDSASKFNQCLATWGSKTPDGVFTIGMLYGSSCPVQPFFQKPISGPWCQSESEGCYGVICADDPDFRLNGRDLKSCDWVATKDTESRCTKEGVLAACPATCFPECARLRAKLDCTDDPNFRLNGKNSKGCTWVAQNARKRCRKNGALANCQTSCNPVCTALSPNPAPTLTAAPTFSACRDLDGFVLNDKPGKTCEWVGKNTKFRCNIKDVATNMKAKDVCPSVCDRRCTCIDSEQAFNVEGKAITCQDIKSDPSHCNKRIDSSTVVEDLCPLKCKGCYKDYSGKRYNPNRRRHHTRTSRL